MAFLIVKSFNRISDSMSYGFLCRYQNTEQAFDQDAWLYHNSEVCLKEQASFQNRPRSIRSCGLF